MTITLKNQYVCKLDLGDFKDFVQSPDLISLLYVEDSAMTLPIIEATFILRDKAVIDYINEGSVLTVGLGKNEMSMLDLRFRITSDLSQKRPSVGDKVEISGILDVYDFINNNIKATYPSISSLDLTKKIAKKYFPIFKTNLDKTDDIQSWQQAGNSWNFLRNVCAQGFLNSDTFLVSAFDNDTFYYYDFRKKLKEAVDNPYSLWVFSKTGIGGNYINYNNSHMINDSGATAEVIGYNNTVVEYNWSNYSVKTYSNNNLGFTSLDTEKLPIIKGINTTSYRHLSSNDNVNSSMAIVQNARNSILNSNVVIFISCGGQFKTLNLLDTVLIDNSGDPRIVGFSTVARIAYQITDSMLYTNITLVRESVNNLKGDLT